MGEGIRRLDGIFWQITVTDPAGNVTRTRFAYNGLTGRVERTVTNFVDGAYDSGQPDLDIITAYSLRV